MHMITTSLLKTVAGGAWPVTSSQSSDGKNDFMVDIGNKYFGPMTQVTQSGMTAPISSPVAAASLPSTSTNTTSPQDDVSGSPAKKPRVE